MDESAATITHQCQEKLLKEKHNMSAETKA